MPPITDPAMLAEIQRQQQQSQIMPPPMPAMTLADPVSGPPMSLPPAQVRANVADARAANNQQHSQQVEDARLGLEQQAGARAAAEAADVIDMPTAQFYAHSILAGAPMPPMGMGKNAARNRNLVMHEVANIAMKNGWSGQNFATQQAHYQAAKKAIGTLENQFATIQTSEQTAIANGQQFIDRSTELPGQTGAPILNSVIQAGQRNIPGVPGHDTAVAMDAAWKTFTSEYARVINNSPTGSGVLSDSARHEAENIIQGNYGLSQKQAAFDQMKVDMANRIKASKKVIADSYDNMTKIPSTLNEVDMTGAGGLDTPDQKKLSTTEKAVDIPEGYQEAHAAFLKAHPPGTLTVDDYKQLRQTLDHQFAGQLNGGVSHMSPDEVQTYVDQYNAGHGGMKIPAMNVPLSDKGIIPGTHFLSEKDRAAAADSTTGMAVAHAADAASFGLGELALTPEQKQANEDASNEHPIASGAGEVVGSVASLSGLEKLGIKGLEKVSPDVLQKLGIDIANPTTRIKLLGDMGVNAAYGADRGFTGAEPGHRGEGALEGGATGTIAALGGNAVTKGVTPLISEAKQAALAQLKGVDLTTLQRLGFGKVEAAAGSIPLAHGVQSNAEASFNTQNANRALQNLDPKLGVERAVPKTITSGTATNNFVNQQLQKAYTVIRPQIGGLADSHFDTAITLLKAGADTPVKKQMFKEIMSAVSAFKDKETGQYTGDSYQAASEKLRGLVQDFSAQAENGALGARDMARAADQARKQMQFLIQRQTPEVGAQLKGIERGYAHSMRIEDASNRNLGGDGIYSPGQYLTSVKKLDTSANKGYSARGKAFDQQYGQAAADIMGPSAVPKHISIPNTFYTMTGLTAATVGAGMAGSAAPVGGFIAGVTAGLYGPGVKRIFQKVLTGQRPSTLDNSIARKAWEGYLQQQLRPGN